MSKRFKGNQVEACGESRGISKRAMKANIKRELKVQHKRVLKLHKYMDTIKDMTNDYNFSNECLNTLVGNLYMEIDRVEGYIDNNLRRLAQLKGDKK